MSILDSAQIKNRIRVTTLLSGIVLYIIASLATVGIALLLLVITGLISHLIIRREVARSTKSQDTFSKRYPFARYGLSFGDFQHVFYHEKSLQAEILARVETTLIDRVQAGKLATVTIQDTDKDLKTRDARAFQISEITNTQRGTSMNLIFDTTEIGKMQSVHWWIMISGFVDRNKKLRFILLAPLTFWFWIIPYIRGNYPILDKVRTIYGASYNDMDIATHGRAVHDIVFTSMVEVLEEHGVDTSEIKIQRMQVMNINISGGKVQMGNVTQGNLNKVMSKLSGGGSK